MTDERLAELKALLNRNRDAAAFEELLEECLEAIEEARTVYLVQYTMNTDPIAGIYRTREAAERAAWSDQTVEAMEVRQS